MVEISSGKSDKDRISFWKKDSYGVTAIRQADGTIIFERGKKETPKGTYIAFAFLIALSVIKEYVILPLIEKEAIPTFCYLITMFIYFIIAIYSIMNVRREKGIQCLKNHAAEHMCFKAYRKLKRVPTVEETRRFSRIDRRCGITKFSALITSQLIGYLIYVYAGYEVSEILLFLIPLCFNTIFPFNVLGKFAQLFTTAKPDEENIELAIAAINELERRNSFAEMIEDAMDRVLKEKGIIK